MEHKESPALRFLYGTAPGRLLLRPLCSPALSRLCGRLLDAPVSRPLIGPFVRKNGIDLADYVPRRYASFNEFFCRRIRPELRPVSGAPEALVCPCDGLLSAYPVTDGLVLPIKQSRYRIDELLGGDPAAAQYRDGLCLVFRLCVDHYHRYCFLDSGTALRRRFLPGVLHTVRPIALAREPVFVRNCREYTVMQTEHLGLVTQIEVGAMLVGKIANHDKPRFVRGEEKGMFRYGGSTVVVLLQSGAARLDPGILRASRELPVRMGQRIGTALKL